MRRFPNPQGSRRRRIAEAFTLRTVMTQTPKHLITQIWVSTIMKPSLRHVLLQFDAELSRTEDGVEERGDRSVATEIGDTLWVASDETVRITCLPR